MRYLIIMVFLLTGCGQEHSAPTHRPRIVTTETHAKTYHFGQNEMIVVDIPQGHDYQTCFVWRDADFKTSAMSCPYDAYSDPVPATSGIENNPAY